VLYNQRKTDINSKIQTAKQTPELRAINAQIFAGG
jgi:hypothetical protein